MTLELILQIATYALPPILALLGANRWPILAGLPQVPAKPTTPQPVPVLPDLPGGGPEIIKLIDDLQKLLGRHNDQLAAAEQSRLARIAELGKNLGGHLLEVGKRLAG